MLVEVRAEAAEFCEGLRRGMDPAEAMQVILDNMMTSYEYATQQVFSLPESEYFQDTITGKRPHPWLVEQERLGLQVVHVAGKAAAMGLAERQIVLKEAQAALFAQVVDAALAAAGIGSDKRRQIHESISLRLEGDIEGTATELAGIPSRVAA